MRPMPRHVSWILIALACAGLVGTSTPAWAGKADVLAVKVEHGTDGRYTFHVTIQHTDEAWDHYADRFDIVGPDGTVLGTQEMLHPHINEQPFTSSLEEVDIPKGVHSVTVRAHDCKHGWGGREMTVELPK
jgi:hypothetical protein